MGGTHPLLQSRREELVFCAVMSRYLQQALESCTFQADRQAKEETFLYADFFPMPWSHEYTNEQDPSENWTAMTEKYFNKQPTVIVLNVSHAKKQIG
eukprot:475987-Hanusia_phi.AAC.1